MEAQAPYSLSATFPLADLRQLVAPVAAWLAALGFQYVEFGPVPNAEESEIMASWESPAGTLFHLMLVAQPGAARCRFFELVGASEQVLCDWVNVQQVSEVQFVVIRSRRFQQASAQVAAEVQRRPLLTAELFTRYRQELAASGFLSP